VITVRDKRKGDLFAQVAVETPVSLTKEQENLLRDFEASVTKGGDKHNPRAGGWIEAVKSFFDRIS
jgi:molecular chaperone DnaJ